MAGGRNFQSCLGVTHPCFCLVQHLFRQIGQQPAPDVGPDIVQIDKDIMELRLKAWLSTPRVQHHGGPGVARRLGVSRRALLASA